MSPIIKYNLIAIVAGMALFSAIEWAFAQGGGKTGGMVMIMLYCLQICAQVGFNLVLFVISLFRRNGHFKFYLLSIVLVLLIGVPLCVGGANLFAR